MFSPMLHRCFPTICCFPLSFTQTTRLVSALFVASALLPTSICKEQHPASWKKLPTPREPTRKPTGMNTTSSGRMPTAPLGSTGPQVTLPTVLLPLLLRPTGSRWHTAGLGATVRMETSTEGSRTSLGRKRRSTQHQCVALDMSQVWQKCTFDSVCLNTCLSTHLSACREVQRSVLRCLYLSACLSACLSAYWCLRPGTRRPHIYHSMGDVPLHLIRLHGSHTATPNSDCSKAGHGMGPPSPKRMGKTRLQTTLWQPSRGTSAQYPMGGRTDSPGPSPI